MNKLSRILTAGAMSALPVLAFAQGRNIQSIFDLVLDLINRYIIPIIIGLAVVWFLWGVAQYVMAAGDEDKKKTGRDHMIYGIIALFVMVAVWGLVNVLGGTLNLTTTPPPLPEIRQ